MVFLVGVTVFQVCFGTGGLLELEGWKAVLCSYNSYGYALYKLNSLLTGMYAIGEVFGIKEEDMAVLTPIRGHSARDRR